MKYITLKYLPFLALVFIISCNEPMPKVTLYPAPEGLALVNGLTESPFFKVLVEDKKAFVYYGKDDSANVAYEGKGISFMSFEMSYGPVLMDVLSIEDIDSFQIRPSPGKYEELGKRQLRVIVDEPSKFLITLYLKEGGRQDLILSAEMPDWKKPKPDDKGVLYLKPGVHQFGEAWSPFVDGIHTLYLEGGAVVEATLNIRNNNKVSILGRGIFSQNFANKPENKLEKGRGISITDVKKVRVEGITVINSPACQLAINNAEEVILKNIKLCGFGSRNNDGLHLYSRNVIAEDLFICSSNDRICLNGIYDTQRDLQAGESLEKRLTSTIVENIQIRNAVLYGIKNGADLMLSRNANADIRTVLVENISSLADTENGFVSSIQKGSGNIYDVVVVDSKLHHGHLLDMQILDSPNGEQNKGEIRSVYLDNISVALAKNEIGIRLSGASIKNQIMDVIFTNISTNNGMVNAFEEMSIDTNAYVSDIKVQVVERDE